MRAAAKRSGFTIVETMIVLAVTGALFLVAFLAINGKQNTTEFQQAINDIQSIIQQTVSQVGAGDYANTNNFTCDGTTGVLNIVAGTNTQGSNTGCIFLGKVMQFGVTGTGPQKYVTYTIAGVQDNNGSLTAAAPTAIAPGVTTNNTANYPNASQSAALHNGLTVACMKYFASTPSGTICTSGGTSIGAVGFISGLGTYNGSQLISGSQEMSLMPITNSTLNTSSATTVDAINNYLKTSTVNPGGGVQICFASGGTNQSGLVTIGSNGRSLAVTTNIKSGKSC